MAKVQSHWQEHKESYTEPRVREREEQRQALGKGREENSTLGQHVTGRNLWSSGL